ncbi:MAG: hydroxymethylbilane synthase [Xanthomonadales bacterium]|nr:hydroxymethylbilane synthase [Xanthomonadales bacterium]
MQKIRIATRESQLALWQAEHVQDLLRQKFPELSVSLVPMTTRGDQILDKPLAEIGGKGLFLKELEQALLADEADIAVHSVKDVPAVLPTGMQMPAFLARANPADAFVSNNYANLESLPPGAIVGTSSLRRRSHLLAWRSDLEIRDLRGNVNTRIAKLDAGEYAAIILACAGLERLGWGQRITQALPVSQWLPSPGQGTIGIECCEGSPAAAYIQALDDPIARCAALAERALAARLGAGCHWPLSAFAVVTDNQLQMHAGLAMPDGSHSVAVEGSANCTDAQALGSRLADQLLDTGGRQIVAALDNISDN